MIVLMNPDLNNGDDNPYDFIFKQDKSGVPAQAVPSAVNKSRQMIIFAAFVGVILILAMVAFSIISSSSKDKATEAISARAYQAELSRVFELGNKNARDVELRKKLITLSLVLTTDQQRVDGVISAKGVVPTPLQLGQARNSSYDKALSDSLQVDNHDEVYSEIIDKLAGEYYTATKAAEAVAKTVREREVLATVRKNIELIYKEQDAEQPATPTPPPVSPTTVPEEQSI
jgi:hypothetical protein